MAFHHLLRQRFLRIAITAVLILSLLVGYQLLHVAPRDPAHVRTLGTLRRVHFMDENLYQRSITTSHHPTSSNHTTSASTSQTATKQPKEHKPGPYKGQADVSNWLVSSMRKDSGGKKGGKQLSESEVLEQWREKRLKMEQALRSLMLERGVEKEEEEEEEEEEFDQEYQNYTPLEDVNVAKPQTLQGQVHDGRVVQHDPLEDLLKDRRSEDFVLDQGKWMETHRSKEVESVDSKPAVNTERQSSQRAPVVKGKSSRVRYRPKGDAPTHAVQASKRAVGSEHVRTRVYHHPKAKPITHTVEHARRQSNRTDGAALVEQRPDGVRVYHRPKPSEGSHPAEEQPPARVRVNYRPTGQSRKPHIRKEAQPIHHEPVGPPRKKRSLSKQKMSLNDNQLRLRGFPLLNYPNLTSEGHFEFPKEWSPSEGLKEKVPILTAAVNHSFAIWNPLTRRMVNQSMDANIIARGLVS